MRWFATTHGFSGWSRTAAVGVSAALVVTFAGSVDAAAEPAAAKAAKLVKEPAATVAGRPDVVSARLAARAQKSRVEVTGARTESSSTFVNPNGSVTVEKSLGAVRVKRGDGWTPVDMSLVKTKAGWAPKASPMPVTFTAGGKGLAATLSGSGAKSSRTSMGLSWSGKLPAPTVKGASATYVLSKTEDLVLRATPEGFEQSLVLSARPATAPVMRLPLALSGLRMKKTAHGGFDAVDVKGKAVFSVGAAVMYSAARDPQSQEPTQVKALSTTLAGTSGARRLDVSAQLAFLRDPKTVYPVTIDPVIASASRQGDTWIEEGSSTPNVSDGRLAIGYVSAGVVRRALLRWDETSFLGADVTSASLTLRNYWSAGCTAQPVLAYPITGTYANTTAVWSNQPAINTSTAYAASASFAYGDEAAGCPNGYGTIDVTKMVEGWASGAIPDNGIELRASETDAAQRKWFCSMNLDTTGDTACTSTAYQPTLSITYNTIPGAPTKMAHSPSVVGTTGAIYTTSLTPSINAAIPNADGAAVTLNAEVSYSPASPEDGSGVFWTGSTAGIVPGAVGSVKMTTALTSGKHMRWRVRGSVKNAAGVIDYGPWSGYHQMVVNAVAPVAPTISCPSYPANTWTTSTGAAVTCTLNTTSTDGSGYFWSLDDPTPSTFASDSSNSGATLTISINPAAGQHTLYARTQDNALTLSATTTTYAFGVGVGAVLTPEEGDQTQKAVTLTAQSSSARTQVTYQYRPGTASTLAWANAPVTDVTPPGSSTPIGSWPQTGTVSGATTNYSPLNWNVAATMTAVGVKVGAAVQVRACFTQAAANQACSDATTFVWANDDFAASADLGPGSVSLTTGNFDITASDVAINGLSIARTHTSLTPAAASTGPEGVFGPGWTIADFATDDNADLVLTDTSASGSLALTDPKGTQSTYVKTGKVFTGLRKAHNGSTLVKSTTIRNPFDSTDTKRYTGWKLTDRKGTVTTFVPKSTGSSTYVAKWVNAADDGDGSGYTRDANGRVTQILAAAPDGVTCTTMVAGCQALNLTYATATTATSTAESGWGNYTGLVKTITYTGYNPATSAMSTATVASYLYDSTGHLRTEWDPRISPALKTRYTYTSDGRIVTDTPPGLAAWTMAYDSAGRLADVSQTDPVNGLAKQSVVYDIPLSGTSAPTDLSLAQTAMWNQTTDLPYDGAAVFPASRVPATATVGGISGVHTPTAADWPYASLTYSDVSQQVVDTATYGAGAWQIDSTRYDQNSATVWELTPANRAQALTPTASTDPYTAAQSSSATRADLLATISTYDSDGIDLISTLGPAHLVQLASGDTASARSKVTNIYDQGAPTTDESYGLVTTTSTSSQPIDGTSATSADTTTVLTGYDPIDGSSATGDTSGWTLYSPTTTTTVMGTSAGSSDIVQKARYDNTGRVVETRMPESSGTDAGATLTTYYTAGTAAAVAACQNKPQWDGLVCQTAPAAQPAGTTIPSTVTTYSMWGDVATVVDTSGTTTRTTTNTFDAAGRIVSTKVAVSPAADGGTAIPDVITGYDTATGNPVSQTTGTTTVTTGYDALDRETTYTDADGNTSTTTYTIDGQPATHTDGKGTYTYTYDGTDANGATEHRGLLTKLDVGLGSMPSQFSAAYDNDGNLTSEVYPNGLTATTSYDDAGNAQSLAYTKGGTAWLTYDPSYDGNNQVVSDSGPNGETDYGYDNAGRLTSVADTVLGQCTTRQYGFSKNGNRTSLTTAPPAADGTCQTGTTTATTSTYDTADRATTTGYTYDKFGRTTTTPAAQVTGGADLSTSYYSNDLVASMTQGTTSKTFGLDPAQRPRQITDTTSGTETRRILNHYTDEGDSPAWIATSTDSGSTWTWQRNILGIDGSLAALQDSTGTIQLQLPNLHGDIVATVDDDVNAVTTNATFEQTEYGLPRTGNTVTPLRYGWLGTSQWSTDTLGGLLLTGTAPYNPSTGRYLTPNHFSDGTESIYNYQNNPVSLLSISGLLS